MDTAPKDIPGSVKAGEAFLLDVRTDEEWAESHAEGAVQMELMRILQDGEVPDVPKDKTIYIYCHSGNRAGMAQQALRDNGFVNALSIGGLGDWQMLGGKIVKDGAK
ncbi:MAG TPA: rhodanese-like domain-containing protein [Candidatus Paceibacterota bacterium]|nr:rhodanese-like domain-containing protein [Candidatus Paceibacterota bacterium]